VGSVRAVREPGTSAGLAPCAAAARERSFTANSIAAGEKGTKAVFQIRPAKQGADDRAHQFFLVGVEDIDLKVGKATWGTNGVFGGPYPLPVSAGLDATIGSQCQSNGFNLADATGITWKGFVTPNRINDRDRVNKDVLVQVGLKAAGTASAGDYGVIGVTGAWLDDGDGVPEGGDDSFLCTGVSQVSVNVTT